jgi:hypothetical protein
VFSRIFQGIASGGNKFFTVKLLKDNGNRGLFYSGMLGQTVELEFDFFKQILKRNQISKYAKLKTDLYMLFPVK